MDEETAAVGQQNQHQINVVKAIANAQMWLDNKTTDIQLYALLQLKGFKSSLVPILRAKIALGWTFRDSADCQLIRDA